MGVCGWGGQPALGVQPPKSLQARWIAGPCSWTPLFLARSLRCVAGAEWLRLARNPVPSLCSSCRCLGPAMRVQTPALGAHPEAPPRLGGGRRACDSWRRRRRHGSGVLTSRRPWQARQAWQAAVRGLPRWGRQGASSGPTWTAPHAQPAAHHEAFWGEPAASQHGQQRSLLGLLETRPLGRPVRSVARGPIPLCHITGPTLLLMVRGLGSFSSLAVPPQRSTQRAPWMPFDGPPRLQPAVTAAAPDDSRCRHWPLAIPSGRVIQDNTAKSAVLLQQPDAARRSPRMNSSVPLGLSSPCLHPVFTSAQFRARPALHQPEMAAPRTPLRRPT
ncbi:uncharacterized protein BDZ99DRAFT_527447 [Mytilinidion resinicola]|uniref:Uncharacterized protein n=1 Tax=Mytilinidion resinicola TaxID=574789 RepID=A0A6A6Y2H1_9PEZI|nr:uncharacterized protein BDZ99DRAFT_527447 [Mytilinidion resinicola]KAF2802415.1 hypothetical protein BDZ99DRAFT_527447 [Mytilinidion resinicola]